ncbi:MAG TPA: hypothetical protein VIY51_19905 [Xanthobacteraceae bacterium]
MSEALQETSGSGEWDAPLFSVFGIILAGALGLFLLLYSLLQPTVVANPGLAAFDPPAATRLVPLARKSDAPALAELPDVPASPLTAFAQASNPPGSAKAAPGPRSKRPRANPAPSRAYDPRPDFAQQWNYDRDWNNNRGWHGGPKSWF